MGYACKLGGTSSGKLNIVTIGSSDSSAARTFNVASILPNDYSKLTIDNFVSKDFYLKNLYAEFSGWSLQNTIINSYSSGILYTNYNIVCGEYNYNRYRFYVGFTILAIYI